MARAISLKLPSSWPTALTLSTCAVGPTTWTAPMYLPVPMLRTGRPSSRSRCRRRFHEQLVEEIVDLAAEFIDEDRHAADLQNRAEAEGLGDGRAAGGQQRYGEHGGDYLFFIRQNLLAGMLYDRFNMSIIREDGLFGYFFFPRAREAKTEHRQRTANSV